MTGAAEPVETLDERLNQNCFCIDVDPARVWRAVEATGLTPEATAVLAASRPGLFARAAAFVPQADIAAMTAIVRAVEAVSALPAWPEAALAWAPPIARFDPGPRGALMGYDFHLGAEGPKLIEINTNAGGGLLNAHLAQAAAAFEDAVWAMFLAEWRLQGRAGIPETIGIIDRAPEGQYLFPEFLLVRDLFARRGVRAVIADPGELSFEAGRLRLGALGIDLVYNRLTDFAFDDPGSAALRQSWLAGAAVVTPNPRNHALLADKRNLTLLGDPARLAVLGALEADRTVLAALPRTRLVTAADADALWAGRSKLFFKPAGGHAGKAVYRGDKLTRGVWRDILGGDYVAQDFAAPSLRNVQVEGAVEARKMDVRLYAYAGEPLLAAARLYQGQTTNFRTPGGGFAPVIVV